MSSEFEYMHVIFHHTDRDEPRTLEIDSSHDSSVFASIVERLDRMGWILTGVEIDDETYGIDIKSVGSVADALIDDPYMVGAIIAFGETFGWDGDHFESGRWGGRVYSEAYSGGYDSEADFAESFVSDCYDMPDLPTWVEIDWEATANNMRDSFEFYEYDGTLHVFHKSW